MSTEPTKAVSSDTNTPDNGKEQTANPRVKLRKKPINPVLEFAFSPLYWPVGFFEWIVAWMLTRKWYQLLFGGFLIVASASIAFASWRGSQKTAFDIGRHYLTLADKAEKNNDVRQIDLLYRRLLKTELQQETRYKFASYLSNRGETRVAREHMMRIAPDDKIGFGLAHLWRVQDLITKPNPDQKLMRHHAEAAYQQSPNLTSAQVVLAQVFLRDQRIIDAIALFEQAARKRPDLNLVLARIHQQLGNKENFSSRLRLAQQYYSSELLKDQKDLNNRRGLIQCLITSNEQTKAVKVAEEGYRLMRSEPSRVLVADCYLAKFDSLPEEERITSSGLIWLERALVAMPEHVPALQRIATLVTENPRQDWEGLKQQLVEVLTKGTAPAIVHVILADRYLERENKSKAEFHLEQAFEQDPQMLIVLNNLAWILAHSDEPDFERAERLVNQANQISPGNSEVLETRGVIYMKMKKYKEAIADLEPLLSVFPDRPQIRYLLAEAYSHFGDNEVAEKYRSEAARLAAEQK